MLYEWIEAKLEQRAWEAVLIVERENEKNYLDFNITLEKIKMNFPDCLEELKKIEELFLEKSVAVKKAYKMGFDDAIKLKNSL